jgi:hypothetical protein
VSDLSRRRKANAYEQTVRLPNGRIVKYKKDMVGNDLTAVLMWCQTHQDPVWVFKDDSYTCPHTREVEIDTHDHVIVEGPWIEEADRDR